MCRPCYLSPGVDFLVPVMGYVCRICHKFYDNDSELRLSHCKSLAHFENLQVSGHLTALPRAVTSVQSKPAALAPHGVCVCV